MNEAPSNEELSQRLSALAEQLAQNQMELARVRERLGSPRFRAMNRWKFVASASIIVSTLVVARIVSADSPPLPGEGVPRQIPYRGTLQRDGAPVTGQTDMTFVLYDDATSTSPLWTESRSVQVVDGIFSVDLGDCDPVSTCPLGALSTVLNAKPPSLYLSVLVAGNPLAGRQRLLSVPYAQYSTIPAGTISAFGGKTAPSGWLLCNGQLVNRADYPALFAAIGTTYGIGDGSTTFAIPDLRGRFVRGFDGGAQRGADARGADQFEDWATALPRAGLNAAVQDLNHTHAYFDTYFAEIGCATAPTNGDTIGSHSSDADNWWCQAPRTTELPGTDLKHTHAISGGDSETRPANIAASWIIRAVP